MKLLTRLSITALALALGAPLTWAQTAQDLSGTISLSPEEPTASWPASGEDNQLSPNYTATITVNVTSQGTVNGVSYALSSGPTTTPTSDDPNVIWVNPEAATFSLTNTATDTATAGLAVSCVWKPTGSGPGNPPPDITGAGDASLALLDSVATWTIARKTQWVNKELKWKVEFTDTNNLPIERCTVDTLESVETEPNIAAWDVVPKAAAGSLATLEGTAISTNTASLGKIKLTYNDGSVEETTSEELAFLKAELVSVGFSGDHMYTEWSTKTEIDPDDDTPIWEKTASPDKVVIYTKSTKPAAFAKFKLEPENAPNTTVILKVEKGTEEVAKQSGVDMDADADQEFWVNPIDFTKELSDKVKITQPALAWSLALDEDEGFVDVGSSTITFYWTADTPTTSPLYELGPQKACEYVDGNTDYAKRCSDGIASDIYYDPAKTAPAEPLKTYDDGAAVCDANALLLQYILKSIGADGGSVVYYWGGINPAVMSLYDSPDTPASFQCDRPELEGGAVPANPYFTYHAMTDVGGTIYDPSYGLEGAPSLTKLVPADEDNAPISTPLSPFPGPEDKDWNGNGIKDGAASIQTGSSLPPYEFNSWTP